MASTFPHIAHKRRHKVNIINVWQQSFDFCIHKEVRRECSGYRPIDMTSFAGKLIEREFIERK